VLLTFGFIDAANLLPNWLSYMHKSAGLSKPLSKRICRNYISKYDKSKAASNYWSGHQQ